MNESRTSRRDFLKLEAAAMAAAAGGMATPGDAANLVTERPSTMLAWTRRHAASAAPDAA
jgi:nitrate reductase NapA